MLDYNTTKKDKIDTIAQLSIVEKYTNVGLWRYRFGHLGINGLEQLQIRDLVHKINLKKINDLPLCANCF
jgi:hypothetical protein